MTTRRRFLSSIAAVSVFAKSATAAMTNDNTVEVKLTDGTLRGVVRDGTRIFTGIPFGASTASAGRFRPPRPAAQWSGVFDATKPAKIAPQDPNFLFPQLPGIVSEDCLQLNVWAPDTPGPHPVLVWAHGGGNTVGSAVEPLFDCAHFARAGIVAVNFNYRLGAFGFLELGEILGPDYRGSANNALLDHLLVLRWVQRNIAAFGGDAKQITVAGESAGGFNLVALLAAPANRGLFQRAIVASGGAGAQPMPIAEAVARDFVAALGGKEKLLTAGIEQLMAAQRKILAKRLRVPFRCVVDGSTLPTTPVEAVKRGSARDVNVMIGWCRDESVMLIPKEAASNPAFQLPTINLDGAQVTRLMRSYQAAYPQDSLADRVWKLATADTFAIPSLRIADAQAAAGGKVLKYRLDYIVKDGPFGTKSAHGFDVPMVFDKMNSSLGRLFGFSTIDEPMARTMRAVWISFIKTGTVNAGLPEWPDYKHEKGATMILDRVSRVVRDSDAIERRVWDAL